MSQETRSKVEHLVRTTKLSNRQIAAKLGRTKRLIRLYANPIRAMLEGKKMPKILVFDIETSPMEIYTWGLYKQRPTINQVIKDWSILSWSAKWLFDNQVMSRVVKPKDAINRRDKAILRPLWKLLDEADWVIAHNGKRFDVRKCNARFINNGWGPPMPYTVIDTRIEASKAFAQSSAKLDWLNKVLKLPTKIHTEYELWVRCVNGDQAALDEMVAYNRHDVVALEDLYVAIRPWIKSHPNFGLYVDTKKECCPNCGDTRLMWKGFYPTPAGRFRAFRCKTCGAIGRSRFSDLSANERKILTISAAR